MNKVSFQSNLQVNLLKFNVFLPKRHINFEGLRTSLHTTDLQSIVSKRKCMLHGALIVPSARRHFTFFTLGLEKKKGPPTSKYLSIMSMRMCYHVEADSTIKAADS